MRYIRYWIMWGAALSIVLWYWLTDPDNGAETVARLQWAAWLVVFSGPVYLLRRALMDGARGREAFRRAMDSSVGAGLIYLTLGLVTSALVLAFAMRGYAAELPPLAYKHLPALILEQQAHWPDVPIRSVLAAQVEQETCPSLKSSKCWNPRTELKTSREYGFGLGQLTITSRFDNFVEARKLHSSLRDWKFEDRYDPARQLRTMILMNKSGYNRLSQVKSRVERLAMALSQYNGGFGGLSSDRRLCAQIEGCDPGKWFGNVELHSLKSKVASKGYGKSFFEINREYVRNIFYVRRVKYASCFQEA